MVQCFRRDQPVIARKQADAFFFAFTVEFSVDADFQLVERVKMRSGRHCVSLAEIEQFRKLRGKAFFVHRMVSLIFRYYNRRKRDTNDIRTKKREIVQTVKFFLQIVITKTQKKDLIYTGNKICNDNKTMENHEKKEMTASAAMDTLIVTEGNPETEGT